MRCEEMFKTKLQEYSQSRGWSLPTYATSKEGPDHAPFFKAIVEVNSLSFSSPDSCRNSKEAQNLAAKLALEHLSCTSKSSIDEGPKGDTHICKTRLQMYAQKNNLDLPEYAVVQEGPNNVKRFRSTVSVGGKAYESLELSRTIKEAECNAAKVALMSLVPGGFQEDDTPIYKNLLQELALKEFSCLPLYTSHAVGPFHVPVFVSTVEIKGETFQGQEGKSKKQAEMNAAKVAYIALRERRCKPDSQGKVTTPVDQGTPEFLATDYIPLDCTSVSNLRTVSDVQPGFCGRFDLGKDEGAAQMATPARPIMGENRASSAPTSCDCVDASVKQQQSSPSTVITNTGTPISLEPTIRSDGVQLWSIVVFPNGPDVKIPPGVTVLERDENHIAVTKFNPTHTQTRQMN